MTIEGDGVKELPDKDEVTGSRLVHEGKNVIKDCEFKVETVNGDIQGGDVGTLQAKGSESQQQEESRETVIDWERFLHVTSIKVLLVENDDSTRHVLTALLRNCKYEVIQAVNGLQAWKILENRTNQIDLVLSEVVMPCLSGIGLLCKIMNHKMHKNLPVIMMSSHDSVGLVFKCLSKGAADFLVKPIRKNELKILWQHVWRRCQSSSGSGSGSGTQTQKSVKSKSSEQSENNSGSYTGEDNQGNAPLGNGSDDGSDTQSSWTKQAVEVDSSQAASPYNQAPECRDTTCAQVNSSNAENSAHMNPSRDCLEEPDNTGKGKPFITGSIRDPELEAVNAIEVPAKHLGANKSALDIDANASSSKIDIKKENQVNHPESEHRIVTAEVSHPQIDKRELNTVVDASQLNNTSTGDSKLYVVELSLKRLRGLRESGITFQDDRNVLRRSELPAFSRYNSSSNHTRTPNDITRSSSLIENSMEIVKNNPVDDIEAHMNKKLLNPSSNGVNDNIAMGSTSNVLTSKPLPLKDTVDSLHLSSAFKPVTADCINSSQQTPLVESGDTQIADVLPPQSSHDIVIQHPHQHLSHHHVHKLNEHCTSSHDDLPLKKLGVDGPHYATSNILTDSCEGHPEYQSLNGSASSNHGSSNAIKAGGTYRNSYTGLAGTSSSGGDASGCASGNTMDSFKLVRAAALTKFRQKRKERCFKKKVRYEKRKKLAEQRPRVRGQFVRQIEQRNPTNTAE
ncbi:unnamed protein product [Withania somnifera]